MALILNIESSTEVCSVSLAENGSSIQTLENLTGQNHAMLVTVYIQEILSTQGININQLDALAVSGGPGSYTGLRIGVAAAKGICYASGLPLIAITSLEAMTHHVIDQRTEYHLSEDKEMFFCPMIDARRMEVYTAIYNHEGKMIREIMADIIDHFSFLSYLEKSKMVFFGNGASKCKAAITHPNACFLDKITTSANYMTVLSERAFQEKKFVDIAYFEPFYLKDFVATIPTKNVFKCPS